MPRYYLSHYIEFKYKPDMAEQFEDLESAKAYVDSDTQREEILESWWFDSYRGAWRCKTKIHEPGDIYELEYIIRPVPTTLW